MNNSTKQLKLNPILSREQRIYNSMSKNIQNKSSSIDKCKQNESEKSLFLRDNALKSNKLPTEFSAEYLSLVSKLKVNIFKTRMAKSVSKERGIGGGKNNRVGVVGDGDLQSRPGGNLRNQDKTIKIKQSNSFREQPNAGEKYRYCSVLNESNTVGSRQFQQQVLFKRKPAYSISNCIRQSAGSNLNISNLSNMNNLSQQTLKNNITSLAAIKEGDASDSRGYKLVRMTRRCKTKPNELFTHMQPQEQECNPQIYNTNYSQGEQLIYHVEILLGLYDQLEEIKQSTAKLQQLNASLAKLLKSYVLGSRKIIGVGLNTNNNKGKSNRKIDVGSMVIDDISHLDDIAAKQPIKKQIRWMVLLQRVTIIAMLDCITNGVIIKHIVSLQQILSSLIGIYLHFLSVISKDNHQKLLQQIYRKASIYTIHVRRDIHASCAFIQKKIGSIMKETGGMGVGTSIGTGTNNTTTMLYYQIKVLITQLNHNSVTINRGFYQLLKLYAVYLNNNELIIQRNFAIIRSFATCPSPYLMKQTAKPYTLVLDLDGTLICSYSNPAPSFKFAVKMRPHLMEFLTEMSKSFELIVWTSSMPQYAQEIIAMLPPIQYSLLRYHTTRYKGKHVKDLARLGRRVETTIIVDNEEGNFMLQPANGIHIRQWVYSSQQSSSDQQLTILAAFLRGIASKQTADVRQQVVNYKAYRKQFI